LGRVVEKKRPQHVPCNPPLEQGHGGQDGAGQGRAGLGEYKIWIGKTEFQERLFFH